MWGEHRKEREPNGRREKRGPQERETAKVRKRKEGKERQPSAQIIDLMMLVVDVVKGVQTQTAECLLIGELTCPRMVVVLNKIDLLPANKRQSAIEKMTKRLHKTLESTRFKDCPVIAVAAKPGGPEAAETEEPQGVPDLIELLKTQTYLPQRDPGGDLLMAVDHCFSIRGQGTVMTGTILQGSLAINDTVEIPALKVTKKVKSVQMFRKPVSGAMQGDRVGVCVTQFDPKLLERGVVCTPGSLRTLYAAVISVRKIGYFKGSLSTRAKFHITVGHETVMARVAFFGLPPVGASEPPSDTKAPPEACSLETRFTFDREYFYQDQYLTGQGEANSGPDPEQWALLEFERPVTCPSLCLVIGSKLDTDIHANACRLAFQGCLLQGFEDKGYAETTLLRLRIYKTKHKEGQVERVTDDYTVIGRNLFKKETNLQLFVGLKVTLSTGETGVIEGGFGQSGKFKIRIQGRFSGCGKSGRPDIPKHIPRIPLGIACIPGEVCSVFILPSVAPNPRLHTGREEKTKTFRKRTSPTSSSLPHT
ncbi:selenocysteine-specific elongation factor isoform X1 [Scomber scombrus]|uniref:Selenocysteine-specific elongation factor isoform X1 n=1 Tax=Scomber scombrus TaxID=13677 RepID=A0AAV1N7X7_SCOSC